MRTIVQPSGLEIQIDSSDLPVLDGWRWSLHAAGYVQGRQPDQPYRPRYVLLHRLLMGALPHELVDHRNGDGLDNQRSNLRITDRSGNGANQFARRGAVPYKGVTVKCGRYYVAEIRSRGVRRYLGCFASPEAAGQAYNAAALEEFGEFANLNEIVA